MGACGALDPGTHGGGGWTNVCASSERAGVFARGVPKRWEESGCGGVDLYRSREEGAEEGVGSDGEDFGNEESADFEKCWAISVSCNLSKLPGITFVGWCDAYMEFNILINI